MTNEFHLYKNVLPVSREQDKVTGAGLVLARAQ